MQYPNMREELIEYLSGLSDREYQMNCWVNQKCPEGIEKDTFDLAVHFLFDDTELAKSPEETIGIFLKDKEEAQSIKSLCDEIDRIFEKYSTELTDKEYIDCPEWNNVLNLAKTAYDALTKR